MTPLKAVADKVLILLNYMIKFYLVLAASLLAFAANSQVNYTANTRVNPYYSDFLYGVNVGHYSTWDDRTKADIAAGNTALNIKGAGVKSYHAPLPEPFLDTWGYGIRVNEFNHYAALGMKDHVIFLETPTAAHKDNTKYGGCTEESKLFKNLYDPIWDGGANGTPINENNYFALYVYKTVSTYKAYTKFWEVINEPDMGPLAFEPVGSPGNWWENAPKPCDLSHIKAPVFHYIRMLRIAYDVVHTLDPTAYVGPGGVGSGSFLDAILRYTDNPVDGSVTPAYPAKGGAYFDALSFHFYPMYSLKYWENGGFLHRRHSDAAIKGYIDHKNYLTEIAYKHGYNGTTYPKKIAICTENGMPRKPFGELAGSDDIQKNFTMKAVIESQKNDVRQYYTFILGDGRYENEAQWEFDVMGFYQNLNGNGPIGGPGYKQIYTNSGKAHKTTSDLLFGYRYDAAKTAIMSLPANVGGGAFVNSLGEFRYVLWAKTTTDNSEAASATYSFPVAANVPAGLKRREWNFMETNATTDISSQNIPLNGTPSFFLEGTGSPSQLPVAQAGTDVTITLPIASVSLDGINSTAPGSAITKYAWTYVSGPAGYSITTPATVSTTVTGLVQGVYIFRLTVTNSAGTTASDDVMVTVNAQPAGQPPVANAGKDETIPVGQATVLHGETSTAAAGIKSYSWAKFSGPSQFEMLTPSASQTWVRNMVDGIYVFRLTVTDNNGLTATDDVQLTVGNGAGSTPNALPQAKAGADMSITLPVNSVTLSNTGSLDADGSITAFNWTMVSGPFTPVIATPNSASTLVSGLIAGSYTFRLKVTDNAGGTATDDVIVTVNNTTSNTGITANAGKDEKIPVGQATVLHGETSTATAGIKSYLWTKFSGPAAYEMLSPTSNQTWIRNMVAGVYVFRLTVTDNNGATGFDDVVITVGDGGSATPNALPVAKAGNDVVITLPANAVTLADAGSFDTDGSVGSRQWTIVGGPSAPLIAAANSASTLVSNLVAGTYTFRLTVTDNAGGTATDDVVVTVNNISGNTGIIANAGKDEAIPVGQATVLHGETSTATAGIKSYAWSKFSGPSAFEMLSPNANQTWIRNMVAGVYVFRLTVTDNNGATGFDDVVITVGGGGSSTPNSLPVAKAGSDIAVTLPTNSVTLNNAGSYDNDGSITSYNWTMVSGPSVALISTANSASTFVSNLVTGSYTFRLKVTDNAGGAGTDDVIVTVNASGAASITANAGKDETIPVGQATVLRGETSTAAAGIKSYAWTKYSGPSAYEMLSPGASQTWIRNMVAGTYIFRLTITDNNGLTAFDDVAINVLPASMITASGNQLNTNQGTTISGQSVVLYPNPVRTTATIKWSGTYVGIAMINVVDASGIVIKTVNVSKQQAIFFNNLDVSELKQGVYIIEIRTQDGKRIIEKMYKD